MTELVLITKSKTWVLVVAALWDGYPPSVRRWVAGSMGLLNLFAMLMRALSGSQPFNPSLPGAGTFINLPFAEFMLVFNSVTGIGLIFGRFHCAPPRARPIMLCVTAVFTGAFLLTGPETHVVVDRVISYHALWHLTGAFGFVFLWAFNQVRFQNRAGQ